MSVVVIVGSQWGDEGKGKIIDYLSNRAEMVVRGQGGNNAGHTVVAGGEKYSLHLVPSGILHNTDNIIGNGVVFDAEGFLSEVKGLKERGVSVDRLYVSDRAHVVFPYHREIDRLAEEARGDAKIGTTKKGIGPAYMDKVERSGIRVCEFINERVFPDLFRAQAKHKNDIITKIYGGEPLDVEEMLTKYMEYARQIKPFVTDTSLMVYDAVRSGKKVLLEGAQGTLLDLDYGTYPFVTSSHPTSGGFTIGSGIGPNEISEVVGITKAYTTRVGTGPFVTELHDAIGEQIRVRGNEFGTTTGRPRRTGWLDMVVVRYSIRVNGMTSLVICLLDVLSGFDEIKICTGYELDGKRITHFPADMEVLSRCKPIYETLPSWHENINDIKRYEDLPENTKLYIERIEQLAGIPVGIISVGAKREQSIVRRQYFE
ncbi:MAG: adenylosuccinate synthase [Bacillota bacterium]|nr:adenylosuccinate synthase [Bacillota bacterium]